MVVQMNSVPTVLDPSNPQHAWAVCCAIESGTQATSSEVQKAAEDSLKACESSAGYCEILVKIITSDAPSPLRQGAVILIRRLVRKCWKAARAESTRVVDAAEKRRLRDFLLGPGLTAEGDKGVGVQLAALVGDVARADWPSEWPSLFPVLVTAACTGGDGSLQRQMALNALHLTLKELSTKRFGFDKKAFAQTVREQFGPIRQLWASRTEAGDLTACILLLKVIRRMLLLGISGLDPAEAGLFLEMLLANMKSVLGALPSSTDAQGDIMEKQLKHSARIVIEMQLDQPVGFRPYLVSFLQFFHTALTFLASATGADRCDPFALQSAEFLRNVLGCSAYREDMLALATERGRHIGPTGSFSVTQDEAVNVRHAVSSFWTGDLAVSLSDWTIRTLLPLTRGDLEEWIDGAETYANLQESLGGNESLHVAGELLFLALLEHPDLRTHVSTSVASMLASSQQLLGEAMKANTITDTVLAADALLLAVGLGCDALSEIIPWSDWIPQTLGGAIRVILERGLHSTTTPPILLRRALWLMGATAAHLNSPSLRDLVSTVATILGGGNEGAPFCRDAAVQLAALGALNSAMEVWSFDPHEAMVPVLGPLLQGLFGMLPTVESFDARVQVLTAIATVLERAGPSILPHTTIITSSLPAVWAATEIQTPLRTVCLTIMVHVVKAIGRVEGAAEALAPVVLPMIHLATDTSSLAEEYLRENGLALWLALVRCSPSYTWDLHNLFPRLPPVLSSDLDNLKPAMLLIEGYVVLGATDFLSAHGQIVGECLEAVVTQVKPQGAPFIAQVMEAVLRCSPVEGVRLLAPALGRMVESVLASAKGDKDCEPDVVIVLHNSVLARSILVAPEICKAVLQQHSASLADIARSMVSLFDAAGGGGSMRRRLWAWALVACLQRIDVQTSQELLDQVVNICVDVLTEEASGGGSGSNQYRDDDSDEEILENGYRQRRNDLLLNDVIATTDLRLVIKEGLERWRCVVDESSFAAALETVEPVSLQQLNKLIGVQNGA